MSQKNLINTKMAAGAALVALSGFVPQPFVNSAQAASASISISGSFITGIQLAAGTDIKMGKVAVTAANGSVVISTAGVVTPTKAVAAGGAPQAGTFSFKAVSTTPNVDITVTGLGALTLAATTGGVGPVGTAKLTKITLGGIGAAPTTLTDGGAGTDKKLAYNINTTLATMDVGATITWGAVQPIGQFQTPITLTIAY
jgi:hypothetical protein